jgi:hypothetical protein
MPTKEDDLKQRLAAVLRDLQSDGNKDPESIWQIGNLGASLIDKAKAKSWPELKNSLNAADYDKLLSDFQEQGNKLFQAGDTRRAYACQAMGISLVCRTQRTDPVMRDGEMLLDALITSAVAIYRKTQQTH